MASIEVYSALYTLLSIALFTNLVIVSVIAALCHDYKRICKKIEQIHGPAFTPIIGNAMDITR